MGDLKITNLRQSIKNEQEKNKISLLDIFSEKMNAGLMNLLNNLLSLACSEKQEGDIRSLIKKIDQQFKSWKLLLPSKDYELSCNDFQKIIKSTFQIITEIFEDLTKEINMIKAQSIYDQKMITIYNLINISIENATHSNFFEIVTLLSNIIVDVKFIQGFDKLSCILKKKIVYKEMAFFYNLRFINYQLKLEKEKKHVQIKVMMRKFIKYEKKFVFAFFRKWMNFIINEKHYLLECKSRFQTSILESNFHPSTIFV